MSEKTPQAGYEAAQAQSSEHTVAAFENQLLAAKESIDAAQAAVTALNFQSDAVDHVRANAELRDVTAQNQGEIDSMAGAWSDHGGARIDAARATLDALNFKSDALAHANAKAELRDAEDAWSASYAAAEAGHVSVNSEESVGDQEGQPDLSDILQFGYANGVVDKAFIGAVGGDTEGLRTPVEPASSEQKASSGALDLGTEIILTNDMPFPEAASPIGTKDATYADVYHAQFGGNEADTTALPIVEREQVAAPEEGDRLSLMQELKLSGPALFLHNRMQRFFEKRRFKKDARREELGDKAFEEDEKQRKVFVIAGLGAVAVASVAISVIASRTGASTEFLNDSIQMPDVTSGNDVASLTPEVMPAYQPGAHYVTKGEGWFSQLEQMNIPSEERDIVMKRILESNDSELRTWVYQMDDNLPGISRTGELPDSVLKSIEKLR